MASVALAGPIVTDSLGGNGNEVRGGSSYKLDVLEVADAVRLVSFAQRVSHETFSGPDDVWFTVYQETTFNDWELVWVSGPLAVGGGGGLKASPKIALDLTPGVRYAVGVYLGDGQFTYTFDSVGTGDDLGWAVTGGAVWNSVSFGFGTSPPELIENSPPDEHAYEMDITVELLDVDGDGFQPPDDCDDEDPLVFPDAAEECDGLDTNCDGTVEENWYVDADGDGFGDPRQAEIWCEGAPDGLVADGTDCDDSTPERAPGAPELCDGLDNDCDGVAPPDEGDPDQDGLPTCADCAPDDVANDCVPIDPDCVGEDCATPDLVVGSGACGCASPVSGGGWLLLVAPVVLVAAGRRRRWTAGAQTW